MDDIGDIGDIGATSLSIGSPMRHSLSSSWHGDILTHYFYTHFHCKLFFNDAEQSK